MYAMAGTSSVTGNANIGVRYAACTETTNLRTVTMVIKTEKEEGLKTEEEVKDQRAEKETEERKTTNSRTQFKSQ